MSPFLKALLPPKPPTTKALCQPPPPKTGVRALLSGHYGGRRSAWDRHGDQKPKKKKKMAFLESARRGRSEIWSFAPFSMKKNANILAKKRPKSRPLTEEPPFQPRPPPGVMRAHTTPPPLQGNLPPAHRRRWMRRGGEERGVHRYALGCRDTERAERCPMIPWDAERCAGLHWAAERSGCRRGTARDKEWTVGCRGGGGRGGAPTCQTVMRTGRNVYGQRQTSHLARDTVYCRHLLRHSACAYAMDPLQLHGRISVGPPSWQMRHVGMSGAAAAASCGRGVPGVSCESASGAAASGGCAASSAASPAAGRVSALPSSGSPDGPSAAPQAASPGESPWQGGP